MMTMRGSEPLSMSELEAGTDSRYMQQPGNINSTKCTFQGLDDIQGPRLLLVQGQPGMRFRLDETASRRL